MRTTGRDPPIDATTLNSDFEPRRPLGSFLATTRAVLLSPARFFAGVSREGPLSRPVLYAVACTAIYFLLAEVSYLLLIAARGELPEVSALGATGLAGALLFALLLFVLSPLFALLGLYVSAAFYQLLVRLFIGRENGGYEATLRVGAYLSALGLLSWVPILGTLVGLWGVWVNVAGLREVHSTTTARAVLVAGIPFVLSTAWTISLVVTGQTTLADVLLASGGFFPGVTPTR